MKKVWQIQPRTDADLFGHILGLRGIEPGVRDDFFHPSLEQLNPPSIFADIDMAVTRIGQAIKNQEPMVVWGDFDADGVTSTAILWETLHGLGAKVMPYIPNRDTEGHGFSDAGLAKVAMDGVRLVVTVDHGITGDEGIATAQALGMEVIVSDHHEPRQQGGEHVRPNGALATIHPLFSTDPQPLAGCGVSYILSYAVWLDQKGRTDSLDARREFARGRLELAAIGTIADLVPLTGNNRVMAAVGLQALRQTERPGLQQLMNLAGIKSDQPLTMYDVGFLIAPRLNAPGRLGDALESLRLLCSKGGLKAQALAAELNSLNQERQALLATVAAEALQQVEARGPQGAYVLLDEAWPAGVCGLAASKVVEATYRPAVVMERQGETSRGSARSIPGFDFTAALTSMSDLLLRFGGHAMAAGFVAETKSIPEIERRLSEMVEAQMTADQLQPSLKIDAQVGFEELTPELCDKLKTLEPCGMANPTPVLAILGAEVADCRAIGNGKKHLKLRLQGGKAARQQGEHDSPPRHLATSPSIDAIAFGFGEQRETFMGQKVDVAFCLEENVWNGKTSLQMKIRDMRLAE